MAVDVASDNELHRFQFFTIVKILHEVSHLLTEPFYRLCGIDVGEQEYLATPVRIGPTRTTKGTIGDCGFGTEEHAFGGMFVSSTIETPLPYISNFYAYICIDNKYVEHVVSDSYVRRVLSFFNDEIAKSSASTCMGEKDAYKVNRAPSKSSLTSKDTLSAKQIKNEEKSSSEIHTGTDDDEYMDSDAFDGDNRYPLFISDDLLKNESIAFMIALIIF
jgi:hypothetical protein